MQINNFNQVWSALENCESRGFHIYNDYKRDFEYRSFADIYNRAGHIAAILKESGIKQGDKVLLCAKTSVNFPFIWLALIWIGAVPVPVPPGDELIGDNNFKNRLKHIVPHFSYYIADNSECDMINSLTRQSKTKCKIITFSDIQSRECFAPDAPERVTPDNEEYAFVQYTSGSTSHPKGILVKYKNLFSNIHGMWSRLEVDPSKLIAGSWLPLYHDMGLVGYFLGCLLTQTELRLFSPFYFIKRPLQFLQDISDFKIEICCMPNFALELLLKRFNSTKEYAFSLETLRWIGVGAEPINTKVLKNFTTTFKQFGLKNGVVSPCYGLAEATLAASIATPYKEYTVITDNGCSYPTVGHALAGIEIKIAAPPEEKNGNILIKGDSVATHALINGKETSITDNNGYYDTKDIGCMQGNELVILGRADEMFIINGENIFPYEIEHLVKNSNLLNSHRIVCLADTIYTDAQISKQVVLIFETKDKEFQVTTELEQKIKTLIKSSLGLDIFEIIAVPRKFVPLTTSGKIKRKEVKRLYSELLEEKNIPL